jgi:hypothetical protein
MRDNEIPAVYVILEEGLTASTTDLPIGKLFNSDLPNSALRFDFESRYQPYQEYALDDIGVIDLIIKNHGDATDEAWRRPLEVKLTVIPDETTCRLPEVDWSPELVIRPASTKYCAVGIYDSCKNRRNEIREIFQDVCGNFQLWNSVHEVGVKRHQLLAALNRFQETFIQYQKPFLLQPVWKTQGKAPSLADQAFDIFVWSDFALCRTFIKALEGDKINRYSRAAARLARMLYVLATQERANLNQIYTEMAYGLQTDKEFSLSGQKTKFYLNTPRRVRPELPKEVVANLILNGGEKLLSPERRFDATVFFTTKSIFEMRQACAATIREEATSTS